MRVVSWNVNSVRARIPRLLSLLKRHEPDIVCLQETKVSDDEFPSMQLESAGYRLVLHGQENYNGVAMLIHDPSRRSNLAAFGADKNAASRSDGEIQLGEPQDVRRGFPGNPVPDEARMLSACLGGLRIVNVYVVNGAPRDSDSFKTKHRWMTALGEWQRNLPEDPPLLVIGDFNVAPDDRDVWNPEKLQDRIHCTDEERAWLRDLKGERFHDLLRANGNEAKMYTWWPYQDGAFERNEGLRFDLALGDDAVVDGVKRVWVDRKERRPSSGEGKPSDHAPLVVDLEPSVLSDG